MTDRILSLGDAAATEALGAACAPHLRAGDVVFLSGPLGAGKTTLARGLITALIGETEVASPTYALVHPYEAGDFEVWHCDLYRLESGAELVELGLDAALENGLLLIEWPQRLHNLGSVPHGLAAAMAERLEIVLAPDGSGQGRTARLSGFGNWERRLHDIAFV